MPILAYAAFFGFNAIIMLALWANYAASEKERSRLEIDPRAAASSAKCVLCDRLLPRTSTRDEVVFELERRIDADTAAVVSCLRELPAPEVVNRLYLA